MANISFLLQSNFNSIYLPQRPSLPIKLRNHFPYSKITKTRPNFKIKCSIMNPNREPVTVSLDSNRLSDVNQVIWRSIMNVLQKPVISGVFLGLLLLLSSGGHRHGCVAMAASGGRMGGSSSRSRSRSSSRYRSRSSSGIHTPLTKEEKAFLRFVVILVTAFMLIISLPSLFTAERRIIKLQVGLLGTATSLQKDLNRIAELTDTSTSQGFTRVLQKSTVALLEHLEYCVSAYSSVDANTEKRFKELCDEERSKFDEETLVNVNNVRKQSATYQTSTGVPNEYIVVTIIVATSEVQQLLDVKNRAQLKEALEKLASIPSNTISATEVLWTPQQENDCLTEEELLKDYPLLNVFTN